MSAFLVTGGAGFIGSHLVDHLVEQGEEVRVLDDFSTGKPDNIRHNLDRIRLTEGSITDLETVREAMDGADYVLHHAAIASVISSVEDPVSTHEANITGTLNVLIAARDAGVRRVVLASSSAVYGDLPGLPKTEEMPTDCLSPYALSKLAGEEYCRMFTRLYGLETVILRYFNVFGPRQDPNSQYAAVIPKFLTRMLDGVPPTIFGDGLQSRDFTYVSNNVAANMLACRTQGIAGRVFNIACGESFSLLDLMSGLNSVLGTSIEPVFEPARPGEVKHSVAGIEKARNVLGFRPATGFADGLEKLAVSIRGGAPGSRRDAGV